MTGKLNAFAIPLLNDRCAKPPTSCWAV